MSFSALSGIVRFRIYEIHSECKYSKPIISFVDFGAEHVNKGDECIKIIADGVHCVYAMRTFARTFYKSFQFHGKSHFSTNSFWVKFVLKQTLKRFH